jgi:RNase H-fold protein (predicted Holliday junction resolvase)
LVDLVVVGWPLSLSGQVTAQTQETKIFIDKLAAQGFQVEREDERLSSRAAQKLGIIKDDAVAAMQILQTYLDRL